MTRGCGVHDIALFWGGNLDVHDRRTHELRLLHTYHTLLMDNGVQAYAFEQCLYEYRLAMLQPLARLMTVLGLDAVPPEQEREWCKVLVPRYCRAMHDLNSVVCDPPRL